MNATTDAKIISVTTESLFVTVPETTLPGGQVVPAFEVGRYLCSKGPSGAVIDATLPPWVDINYADARAACAAAGFKLITELQALSLAFNIASQPCNWIGGTAGGAVGVGKLYQGLRDWSSESAEPGNFEPADPDQQRWFVLPDGSRICDVAGNAYSWVFDDVQGDEHGIVARAFAADSPTITTALAPSMEKGMGWQPKAGADWSGRALLRGGCFGSGDYAGVFDLDFDWPGNARDNVGFRCTK